MPFDAAHLESYASEVAGLKDKTQNAPPNQLAFYGSSSIRLWPGLARQFPGAHNLGFGGSTLFGCAHYFEPLVAPLKPRALVIYAGDNDLALGASPQDVWESLQKLLDQSGEIPLAFLSLKPSPARSSIREKVEEANTWCQREIWNRGALWVDIYAEMLDHNGQPRPEFFVADGIHLSRAGYTLWEKILRREVPFLSQT